MSKRCWTNWCATRAISQLTASARWRYAATTRRTIPKIRSPTWRLCPNACGSPFRISGTRRNRWPKRMERCARPISSASTPGSSCNIEDSSTMRGDRPGPMRRASCTRRWSRFRAPAKALPGRRRASAARSSGVPPPEGDAAQVPFAKNSGLQKKLAQPVEHGTRGFGHQAVAAAGYGNDPLVGKRFDEQRRVRWRRHQVTLSQHHPCGTANAAGRFHAIAVIAAGDEIVVERAGPRALHETQRVPAHPYAGLLTAAKLMAGGKTPAVDELERNVIVLLRSVQQHVSHRHRRGRAEQRDARHASGIARRHVEHRQRTQAVAHEGSALDSQRIEARRPPVGE